MVTYQLPEWHSANGMVKRHHTTVYPRRGLQLRQPRVKALLRVARRAQRAMTLDGLNALVGAMIVVLGLVYVGRSVGERLFPARPAPVIQVTVHRGDTLWSIASRYGSPDDYILRRVNSLAARNRIAAGSYLQPGMHLQVPVENPKEQTGLMTASAK